MKQLLTLFVSLYTISMHAQVFLDENTPDSKPLITYEELVKTNDIYAYNTSQVYYSSYNSSLMDLKFIYDLFANITHINPNVSNVVLNIYKPGERRSKTYSYIDIKLDNDGVINTNSWFSYYENCFKTFFTNLSLTVSESRNGVGKLYTFTDTKAKTEYQIYFYEENNTSIIQLMVNQRDNQLDKQLFKDNLASN